jgi:sterol desaturase/sphingolipid hydroxylase (fatty acid hydroxylase superfamily)
VNQAASAFVVVLLVGVLFVAERLAPLRRDRRPLFGRLVVNLSLSALTFVVAALWVRPVAVAVLGWAHVRPFGLVQVMSMSVTARAVLSFLLMDLTFYWWHVANHRIPFLWRFHNVHHIDPDLDVSTAFRFHVCEVALSAGFRVAQVGAIGLSPLTFAAYELVFQASTAFHHSNVRLPIRLERVMNLIFVTPRMHGIHHSQVRDETNSNYSVVFSWWDRLHRTIGLNIPQADVLVGVPGYTDPADNRPWSTLVLPFGRQRDYWRRRDGTAVNRDRTGLVGRPTRLAE